MRVLFDNHLRPIETFLDIINHKLVFKHKTQKTLITAESFFILHQKIFKKRKIEFYYVIILERPF